MDLSLYTHPSAPLWLLSSHSSETHQLGATNRVFEAGLDEGSASQLKDVKIL
jgi:hypothetical protein